MKRTAAIALSSLIPLVVLAGILTAVGDLGWGAAVAVLVAICLIGLITFATLLHRSRQ